MSGVGNMPAFPSQPLGSDGMPETSAWEGMSLRDWFATHCDQPGVSEIISMAGGETDGYRVKFSPDGTEYTFNEWWNGLPLEDRLSLSARVRYAMADAMLAARTKGGES